MKCLSVIFLLLEASCSTNNYVHNVSIVIDDSYSYDAKTKLVQNIVFWEEATQKTSKPIHISKIEYVTFDVNSSKQAFDLTENDKIKFINHEAYYDNPSCSRPNECTAITMFSLDRKKIKSSVAIPDRLVASDNVFRCVVLHELGHVFGLDHNPGFAASIMDTSISYSNNVCSVTCYDLHLYCKAHDCNVNDCDINNFALN